jgi:NAD(P)H-dependent FMN reductase
MKFLTISGSLRAISSNTALLRAAALVAPPEVSVVAYLGLAELPQFNPDRELDPIPAVLDLRAQLATANAVIISSPEYAHGVPGALKNALDWVVGTGELVDKPVGLFNASPRATIAHASLVETLKTMSANVIAEASVDFPLLGRRLDAEGIAADPTLGAALRAALAAIERVVASEEAAHLLPP